MADFCRQCSLELFGEDFRAMANLMPPEKYSEGVGATALCEDCGSIVVDIDGNCIADWCRKHGKTE